MIATKKLGKEKKYMTFLDQALCIKDWPPFFSFQIGCTRGFFSTLKDPTTVWCNKVNRIPILVCFFGSQCFYIDRQVPAAAKKEITKVLMIENHQLLSLSCSL